MKRRRTRRKRKRRRRRKKKKEKNNKKVSMGLMPTGEELMSFLLMFEWM